MFPFQFRPLYDSLQVYSLVSEVHRKAASLSNEENWFRATALWALGISVFSENYLFAVEISKHLMTFLLEKHVTVLHLRLEQIKRRKFKAIHPALSIL
jgi:hypothetical protein